MEALRELYQQVILDHNRSPRNRRPLPQATCSAEGKNPLCGDRVIVRMDLDPQGRIRDVAFEGEGCAISIASASLMTEALKGKTPAEAAKLYDRFHGLVAGSDEVGEGTLEELGGLCALTGVKAFPMRVKCASLAWHAAKAALASDASSSALPVVSTEGAP